MEQDGVEFHFKEFPIEMMELPWKTPLEHWDHPSIIEVERGISRHEVIFLELNEIFALKELPKTLAEKEFQNLIALQELNIPAVRAVGYVLIHHKRQEDRSIIITKYLDHSIPYRTIFMRHGLSRYQGRLLDALSMLLVNLHLNNFYWGDCSLSNVLFRRDAGQLQAYLVDTETSAHLGELSDAMRNHDLEIMNTNVYGDLLDLSKIADLPNELEIQQVGEDIIQRYYSLWDKINQKQLIDPMKRYQIHEYIQSLNELGFSVDEIELIPTELGDKLELRTIVTDRNYHRHLLQNLTGIVAEEHQAQLILNDIREFKVMVSQEKDRSVSLQVSAHSWLSQIYLPIIEEIMPLVGDELTPAEGYCQVLENKWFLSEKRRQDVGMEHAFRDYLNRLEKKEIL